MFNKAIQYICSSLYFQTLFFYSLYACSVNENYFLTPSGLELRKKYCLMKKLDDNLHVVHEVRVLWRCDHK